MAGVALSGLGELEKAEAHYQRALELAEADGKPEEIARGIASLAGLHYKRGEFAEAIAAGRQARQVCADPSLISFAIEAECLRDMGRFDEARAVMEERRRTPGFDQPHLERRTRAMAALGSAWIETRAERPDAALAFLEQAREGLLADAPAPDIWPPPPAGGDDKLLLWCDATKTLALAQKGDVSASTQLCEAVLSRLTRFNQDRTTLLGTDAALGRAAFILGSLGPSQQFWCDYLDCRPDPVGLPSAHYHLGEIALRLG